MNLFPNQNLYIKTNGGLTASKITVNGNVFEPMANNDAEANQRSVLVEWFLTIIPNLNLQAKASDEELRARLIDGTVLCRILNRLRPSLLNEGGNSGHLSGSQSENVKRFLAAMDELGIPKFEVSDLEKGSMKPVIGCLLALRGHFMPSGNNSSITNMLTHSESPRSPRKDASLRNPLSPLSPLSEERQKVFPFQRTFRDTSATMTHHGGHKFHEVFQLKQGRYTDLPPAKISEMMKSNSLDNAPTQSLLSVVNSILDESVERQNSEIPYRVACLLRKVVQEIERRISTQAEHLRTQNNLFKAREEKYQSRIRVLEALASGTCEETEIGWNQFQQIKTEKYKLEEKRKLEEEEEEKKVKSMKEKDQNQLEISTLKQDKVKLMEEKDQNQLEISTLKQLKVKLMEEKDQSQLEISTLKQENVNLIKEKNQNQLEISALKQDKVDLLKKKDQNQYEISTVNQDMADLIQEKKKIQLEILTLKQDKADLIKEKDQNQLEISTLKQDKVDLIKEKDRAQFEVSTVKQELETVKKTYELRCLQVETEAKVARAGLETRIKELEHILADWRSKVQEIEANSESKSQSWIMKEQSYHNFVEFQFGALRELRLHSKSIRQEILTAQKTYLEEFNRVGMRMTALAGAAENYHAVLAENRKLFNELQELKGNIRVYCRMRPLLPGQAGKKTIVEYIGEHGELAVANPAKQGKEGHRMFRFNKVFSPAATQGEVFSDIQPLIRSVLDGYNVCIFAYGQTGSGKTYTMSGPDGASEEDLGVNYRALNDLFNISQSRSSSIAYEIGVQMVEIYNEQVRDLLSNDSSQKKLGIMSRNQLSGLAVPDASMHPVTSTSDVMELMNIGLKNRAMGATAMNERSSRSHSVLTIHVPGKDLKTGSALHGNLHLVDLAGSERVDRSEATGDRLKEAQHINKSLSALGDVVFALAQKSPHVPYRNSKLTQLLQSSLGGQAKTLMFVQLNPEITSYTESISTLKFAERVSGVELGAAKSNKEGRDVRDLMEQVSSMKDTIAKKDEEIERLQLLKDLKNVYPGGNEKPGAGSLRYGSLSPRRKRSQKLSSGKAASDHNSCSDYSDKGSEADSQQSMDDLKHQNEFLRQSKVAEVGQNISADAQILVLGEEAEYEERLSDTDAGFSMPTEPDGSSEFPLSPGGRKPSDSSNKTKPATLITRNVPKLGQSTSMIFSASKTSAKVPGVRKSTVTGSSSAVVKPPRRWQ